MRVISGIYKGRRLTGSHDLSIRPTTDRIKELIFNVLQDFPVNCVVADIFSGSGSLGIEALSRGSENVVFVEKNASSIEVLKKNLSHVSIPESDYSIIRTDALDFARDNTTEFDLLFMDPPFVYPPLQNLVDLLMVNTGFKRNALLVVEHEVDNPLIMQTETYAIFKQKQKGRSLISFIERRERHG